VTVNNINVHNGSWAGGHPGYAGARPTRVSRGENNLYHRPGNAPRNASVPHGRPNRPVPPHAANQPNNIYAGKDGNVYRRTNTGWQTRDKSGWKPAPQGPGGSSGVPRNPAAGRPGARPAPGSSTPAPAAPAPSAPAAPAPGRHPAPPPTTGPATHRTAPGQPPPGSARPAAPPQRPSGSSSSLERAYQGRQRGSARVQGYRSGGGSGGARPPSGGGRPHGSGGHRH